MVKEITKVVKKKKKWIVLIAPKELNNLQIGESLCFDSKELIGRTVEVNLGSLVNDMKKQSARLRFKVIEVKDERAATEIIGYNVLPVHVKRIIRRGREKIDDSFVCESKDNIKIRVKPLILTKSKTKRSVLANLEKQTRQYFADKIKNMDYNNVISSIITNKLQREIKNYLKKIYPISIFEIRILERV